MAAHLALFAGVVAALLTGGATSTITTDGPLTGLVEYADVGQAVATVADCMVFTADGSPIGSGRLVHVNNTANAYCCRDSGALVDNGPTVGCAVPACGLTALRTDSLLLVSDLAGSACYARCHEAIAPGVVPLLTLPQCSSADPNPNALTHPTVFEELSADELIGVRDWLYANFPELVPFTDTTQPAVNQDYLALLERQYDPKADVLDYLDNNGATIYRGSSQVIDVYVVGPIPIPLTLPIPAAAMEAIAVANPPAFNKRNADTPEYASLETLIGDTMAQLETLSNESYGGTYADGALTWSDIAPRGIFPGLRQTWIWFMQYTDGFYIRPIGLEMLLEHYGSDSSTWSVLQIVYNEQPFDSAADLAQAYANNNLVKFVIPPEWQDPSFSSLRRRNVPPRPLEQNAPPNVRDPTGPRFTVDGYHAEWMGWAFDFGVRQSGGLQFWDLRFKGDRVAYEIAHQEASANYAGYAPMNMLTNYLDTNWGNGQSSYELVAGVDCPDNAVFRDLVIYVDGQVVTHRNALCIFEFNNGLPISRHFDSDFAGSYTFYGATPSTSLIVRVITSVYNYDYIHDWIFALNGGLEIRTHTTGYLQSGFSSPVEGNHGFPISPFSMGIIHDHNLLYKFDVDVLGTANTFKRLKIVPEVVTGTPRWRNVPQNWIQRKLAPEYVDNENNATIFYSMKEPEYWLLVNRDAATNRWGSERAYRLNINGMTYSMTTYAGNPATNPMQWQKYHLIVTKRKDSEMFGSSLFDQVESAEPYVNLLDYVDGESIAQEDLVAWVNTGLHHIPHSEDSPTVQTPGAYVSVLFRPFNYFDEDPSMDLLNGVFISPSTGRVDNGVVNPDCAYEPSLPTFSGSDIVNG